MFFKITFKIQKAPRFGILKKPGLNTHYCDIFAAKQKSSQISAMAIAVASVSINEIAPKN